MIQWSILEKNLHQYQNHPAAFANNSKTGPGRDWHQTLGQAAYDTIKYPKTLAEEVKVVDGEEMQVPKPNECAPSNCLT